MALKIVETDTGKLYDNVVQAVEIGLGEPLYPGDERRLFLEALMPVIGGMFNHVNAAANAMTLDGAYGEILDALGERTGTKRLAASAAGAPFLFTLTEELNEDLVIPTGTQITDSGDIYFATDRDLVVSAGETAGTVTASCMTKGALGNGYMAGAIAQLVEVLDGVESAANTETTSGGVDEESDSDYRERIRLSPFKASAGTIGAYKYWALSADSSVIDVAILAPSEATVEIYPLCTGGSLPSEAVLAAVEESCSDDEHRGMTDDVHALSPTAVPYDIEVVYYTTAEDEAACVESIEGEGGALEQYIEWQSAALGRAINPDRLRSLCLNPTDGKGCTRLTVAFPSYRALTDIQVAAVGSVTVTHEVET